MNPIRYKESDLPIRDMETIGLADQGKILLNADDLNSLLSGGRTALMNLRNLEAENIKIKSIDAKLSLHTNEAGKTELLIHPIYKKPRTPGFLGDNEAKQLESGEVANLLKETIDDKGNKKELLVEYDAETREFIISDTQKIVTPDMVNGEFMTASQKESYKKGKEVELPDHTRFQYAAADTNGIRSNRLALIASVLVDGGLSYMAYKGLHAMFGEKHDPKEANNMGKGYDNAYRDMKEQQPVFDNSHIQFDAHSRGL